MHSYATFFFSPTPLFLNFEMLMTRPLFVLSDYPNEKYKTMYLYTYSYFYYLYLAPLFVDSLYPRKRGLYPKTVLRVSGGFRRFLSRRRQILEVDKGIFPEHWQYFTLLLVSSIVWCPSYSVTSRRLEALVFRVASRQSKAPSISESSLKLGATVMCDVHNEGLTKSRTLNTMNINLNPNGLILNTGAEMNPRPEFLCTKF